MGTLRQKIIELSIRNDLLTPHQLEEIINIQRAKGGKFSALLLEKRSNQKANFIELINGAINFPRIDVSGFKEISSEILKIIPGNTAKGFRIFPIGKEGKTVTLVIADPLTILDLEEIEELKGYQLNLVIAHEPELLGLVNQYYPDIPKSEYKQESMNDILGSSLEITALADFKSKQQSEIDHIDSEAVPIIKATNFILERAIELKASDILIEALEKAMRIRLRIDGMLHQTEVLPLSFHPFIVSRIKVISNLDISEHRFPQDGQFKIKLKDKEVEFRVSVVPSVSGEKVTIRVLDKSSAMLDIDKLGLRLEEVAKLKKAALLPHGMILVCGPTGSGKTTTLYSILKYIHSPEKNIVTVEDPVEYQIKGINQVSVNVKTGLIFSRCLRAILRQDPNVIMIGEIRDFETVDIAIKAALTGHLVLSTLHTTTAVGSIVRLLDMGVQPFLISASVIAIISQRLARKICPCCKEKVREHPYFIGRGCKECLNSGYSGRILVTEILYISPKIKELILAKRIDEQEIKKVARAEGMKTLREEITTFALAGITSMEEAFRVTPAD
jgi:type IV pilus assembly protein PilB